MITNFLTSLFGQLMVGRIFSEVSAKAMLSSEHSKYFQRIIFVVLAAQTYLLRDSQFKHWLFIGILLLTLKFFPALLKKKLEKSFRRMIIPVLDELILEMKMGKSFRFSFVNVSKKVPGWMGHQLKSISKNLESDSEKISLESNAVADFEEIIREIDRTKSKTLERVQSLRTQLKMIDNFRRRSGQVSAQIRMQAIIVTMMYVALLFFVIMHFGYVKNQKAILLSAIIYLSGILSIFFLGKRLKWKV